MDSEARSIVDDDPRCADGRRRQISAAVRFRIVTQAATAARRRIVIQDCDRCTLPDSDPGCDRCTPTDSGPELRPLYADG
jgi:hypothetical protein